MLPRMAPRPLSLSGDRSSRRSGGYPSEVARGETRGERRRRRRRDRNASSPLPDHSMLPRPLTEEEDIVRAMEDQAAWARAIWATAERRLLLSLGVLVVWAWMLVSALSDPDEFFARGRRMAAGFVVAPLLAFMFGL